MENLLAIELKKNKYLWKILYSYKFVKPKYEGKGKLCYMDMNNLLWIKKIITKRKILIIGLTKDILDEKIMSKFVALRPKTYSYLTNGDNKNKK